MARRPIAPSGLVAAVAMIVAGTPAIAHPSSAAKPAASAEPTFVPAAAKVVDAFHAALDRGDTTAAAGFLADALIVFEGGEVERSKAEYAGRHLPADAVFTQTVGSPTSARSFCWARKSLATAAWPVEDRHVELDAEAKIGVLVERPLLGGVDVGGLQAYRLVAVSLGQLDAAVPLAQKWIKGVQSNT